MDDNKKFWERMARFYAPIQERSNHRLYEEVINHILPYLKEDMEVLELACGSGQLTFPLYSKVKTFIPTDFSEKMVAELQKKAPETLKGRVEDATHLSFENEKFDVVLMGNALHCMPFPEKALEETLRVLKKDGLFIAPTFVYEGKCNRFRMKVTELVGFKTFHHWTSKELSQFVCPFGFKEVELTLLKGDPLPEAFACFQKK